MPDVTASVTDGLVVAPLTQAPAVMVGAEVADVRPSAPDAFAVAAPRAEEAFADPVALPLPWFGERDRGKVTDVAKCFDQHRVRP